MENSHGFGVTPCSCHAKFFVDLAEYPRKLNPTANVTIPSRRHWQTPAANLRSTKEGCLEDRPTPGEMKMHCPHPPHPRAVWEGCGLRCAVRSCAKPHSRGEYGAVSPLQGAAPTSGGVREVGCAQVPCTVCGNAAIIKKSSQSGLCPDSTVQMGAHICLSFSGDNCIYTSWLKCFNKWSPDENAFLWLQCWASRIFTMIQITVQIMKGTTNHQMTILNLYKHL